MRRLFNENLFTLLFVLAVGLFVAFGPVSPELYLADVIALKLAYVAALLGCSLGLFYFLRGTSFDVLREVFDEHNLAASVLVAGFLIAIALAVAG